MQNENDATRPLVQCTGVVKQFGEHTVLRDVNLELFPGEVLALIGPSGSGKSTLLRLIAQLETLTCGEILLDEELLGWKRRGEKYLELSERKKAAQRRNVGFVFQQFNLFPHLTVLENIIEPLLQVRGTRRDAACERGRALLEEVGLAEKAESYPVHLSGGQQQRVAIARALALRPKVMLFDEPTSALDSSLVSSVTQMLGTLASHGVSMIVVTHDERFASEVSTRMLRMAEGVLEPA